MTEGPEPERGLASRLARDVDDAFEDLVAAHQDRLYAFVLGMAGDRGQAEEVVQDAFLKAYRALRQYPSERVAELRLHGWLRRIALNTWRNALRRKRVPQTLDWTPPDEAEPGDGPEALALRRVDQERLLRALATIPAPMRAAILLRHVDDLATEEVAAILRLPAGTVKSHVYRGLNRLREALSEEVS
ncbi:MAG: RNA polymerase sigma factor [Candidatus Dormibacteraceae bacterium]